MPEKKTNLVILVVLDGWGMAPASPGNAITGTAPANFNRLWSSFPHTQLGASGEAVGLPRGEPGNTETGHLNLGAGRIVFQDLPRINLAIADGTFFENKVLLGAIEHAKKNNSRLHLLGLSGAGGVHSNMEHLFALLRLCQEQNFNRVFVHIFTDGRDSPPSSALTYLEQLKRVIVEEGVGQIATVMGRYWAMDRDFRWDRTAKAYFALTGGVGQKVAAPEEAIQNSYKNGVTDEFIEPHIVVDQSGVPLGQISDNDSVIFYNFRIDRPRQLTYAFVLANFEKEAAAKWDFDPYTVKYYRKHLIEIPSRPVFQRDRKLTNLFFVTMTEYAKDLNVQIAFPREIIEMPIGRVLSEKGIRQLHAAESEKERFVTYYFNGQQEQPFSGEDRLIVPSPKVATYDLAPAMSTRQLTLAIEEQLRLNPATYGFILINYANPDMVGHTGVISAAVSACAVADECLGRIYETSLEQNAILVVTADHGNAEEMLDPITGEVETEHSKNPVPFILAGKQFFGQAVTLQSGILADVAPTILSLLGMEKPPSMTGRNLLP